MESKEIKSKIATEIWKELSEADLNLFSLPNQFGSKHLEVVGSLGDKLIISSKTSAVIVSLEQMFSKKYKFTLNDSGHIIVEKI